MKGVDYIAPKWRRMYSIWMFFLHVFLFFLQIPGMLIYRFPLTWAVGETRFSVKFTKSKHSIWMVSTSHSLQNLVTACGHFCLQLQRSSSGTSRCPWHASLFLLVLCFCSHHAVMNLTVFFFALIKFHLCHFRDRSSSANHSI